MMQTGKARPDSVMTAAFPRERSAIRGLVIPTFPRKRSVIRGSVVQAFPGERVP
jgi:hypothetical protein